MSLAVEGRKITYSNFKIGSREQNFALLVSPSRIFERGKAIFFANFRSYSMRSGKSAIERSSLLLSSSKGSEWLSRVEPLFKLDFLRNGCKVDGWCTKKKRRSLAP